MNEYSQVVRTRDRHSDMAHLARVQELQFAVCHVCGGGDWAGAESQAATLLKNLSRFPQLRLYAIALHEGRFAQELRRLGVDVFVAHEERTSFLRVISDCSRFVRSRGIHILHSHCYKENILSLLLSVSCNVPCLVRTEHGRPEPYSVARNLKHWFVLELDRLAARYTRTSIIGVSSDLAEFWKQRSRPQQVSVVRNGVDLDRVKSRLTRAEAKIRLGISPDKFVVGIVGRLEQIKRHDLFVATAKCLADEVPCSTFLIAGGGRQEEGIRRLVHDSGLEQRFSLIGERTDIYDVIRSIDVLLICSDHEGIPMVMLEAMALGTAVVAREVGGIPEVIRDGLNGVLVKSASPAALARGCRMLFEDPEKRSALTRSAFDELCVTYSAGKNAAAVLEHYQTICNRLISAPTHF